MGLAEIYKSYSDQLKNLQTTAQNVSDANRGQTQRKWRVPENWSGDPTDIKGLGVPTFQRKEMNAKYPTFFSDPKGTVADAMVTKIQADHLGYQERAWRLQFASGIRCHMHAASRREGHGDSSEGSFARITDHLMDQLVAGNT